MASRYFIFLCLLFSLLVLTTISYIIQRFKEQNTVKEPLFTDLTQCSEAKNLTVTAVTDNSTSNIKNTTGTLPLSQYHIFSSWNTACSGKFVSTQQIQNVLSTGCRFVDFQLTDMSGTPIIHSPRFTNENSSNSITLQQAIKTCMDNAFQNHIVVDYDCSKKGKHRTNKTSSHTYVLNNYDDPLFIQLRFEKPGKSQHAAHYKEQFLNKVAEVVGHGIRFRQYRNHQSDNLSTDTPLKDLSEKIIVLVDISNLKSDAFDNSHLPDVTNLVVGHHTGVTVYPFQKLLNSNIPPQNIPITTSSDDNFDAHYPITQYTMAIPDSQLHTQPSLNQVIELAAYHKAQFIPCMFYQKNHLTKDYIDLFQQNKSAFLPIATLYTHLLDDADTEKAVLR